MEIQHPLKLVNVLFMCQLLAIIFIANVSRGRVTVRLGELIAPNYGMSIYGFSSGFHLFLPGFDH
jgi:hypothetical protein